MNLNFRQIASKLSPTGWIAVGGAALGGIVFLILVFNMASSPSYSTVVAGVSPAQTGNITSALSTAGIQYQLQNNGTAVAVPSAQEAQARVVLDGQNLLSGSSSSPSLEKLLGSSSSTLGSSQQQQQEQLISALEQQLQQQISSMNGINSAQVALAIPDPANNLFSATNTQPSGSVLLNTTGVMDATQVKSIASMVGAAVPGLNANKVTVTDQNGDLLWPQSTGSAATSATSKQAAQQAYDRAAAAKADSMLEATVGPGMAVVQVNADLNTNQTTQDSVSYAKKGTPLTTNLSKEKLTGNGTAPSAAGNTATQIAAYAGKSSGTSNYSNKTAQTTYGVSKKVTRQVISPGAVNNQTISVLLSSKVPKSEVPAIQSAVENAVGYVAKRDTISVGAIPFAKQPTPAAATGGSTKTMIGYVKYVAIGLAAMLFLFFITRMLRRRETEQFAGNPTWLRELEHPRPLSALEGQPQMADLEQPPVVARLRPPVNLARQQVEELVERDPERVASQVRQWMTED